jgi:vancomycin aglycone glucosyltransferase
MAATAAAPHFVRPHADKPCRPAPVAALGVGAAHDGPNPTLESLSDALTSVDEEQQAESCGGHAHREVGDGEADGG